MDYIQVMTTVPKREDAERISKELLKKRLAACIQFFEVRSLYWWEGNVEESSEYLLLIKTKSKVYGELEREILSLHPYETPEIIAVPIRGGFSGYLDWIDGEVK